MNSACKSFRAGHLHDLAALRRYAADPAPSGHTLTCRACARFALAAALHARALSEIARMAAPLELDGWTVAALHAGRRQERAAAAVAGLSRELYPLPVQPVSAFGDEAMPRLRAPAELEARVAHELGAETNERLGRHLGRLTRRAVPADLDARVQAELRQGRTRQTQRRLPAVRVLVFTAAASLLFLAAGYAGASWLFGWTGSTEASEHKRLQAILLPSPADSSPELRSLLPGVDGAIPVEALSAHPPAARPLKIPTSPTSNGQRTAPNASGGATLHQAPPPTQPLHSHPLFEELVKAPMSVVFSGERTVEAVSQLDGGRPWIHRERVHSQGNGQFAIVPLTLLQPRVNQQLAQAFLVQQDQRQGLNYRYRDFHIHDLRLFFQNYSAVDSGSKTYVAGRECAEFRIEKLAHGERRYTIAVDLEHGLVLRYLEETLAGDLVAKMEFTAVDFAPDLTQVTWHVPRNAEQLLVQTDQQAQALGFQPILPRTLPPGYQMIEQAIVRDELGKGWLKTTYGDGVERLFFVHGGPVAPGPMAAKWPKPDRVEVLDAAPWTSAQGNLSGEKVIALGKVSADELLVVLDSSRP